MGFFSGKTKQITTGGNIIRGIKDEGTALRPLIDRAIQAGDEPYQGFGTDARIAGFTDPQVAGQEAALGVAGQGIGGLQGIQQGIAGLRQTAAGAYQPLTQQDIAAQRQLLAGSEDAQKLAAERAFKEGLMDIGGAAAGSAGGYTGTRADLLRGDALGTYSMGLAGIEGDLQKQAYQGALDQRALAAQEANQMAQLYGLEAGAEADVYGRQLGQAQTQMDVGALQQAQEQARRDFDYQEFLEEQNDPFLKAQKATGAVTDFSTLFTPQQTTLQKKKSGFDRALGVGMMVAGATMGLPPAATASLMGAGAGQASSAYGGRLRKYAAGSTVGGSPMTVNSILASKTSQRPQQDFFGGMSESEFDAIDADITQADADNAAMDRANKYSNIAKAFGETKVAPEGSGLGQPMGGPTTSQQQGAGDRRIEYRRGIARANGGSIALEEGGILSRVFGGAKNIASSIGSGIATGASNAYQNFQNMSPEDKMRYGLAILAEEDKVGDSGGQALARAVSGVKEEKRAEDLEKEKLEAARAKTAASERLLRGGTTSDSVLENAFKDKFTSAQIASPGYGIILQKAKQYARDKSIEAAQKGLIARTAVERDNLAQNLMIEFADRALADPAYMNMLVAGAAGQKSGGVSGPSLPPFPQGLVATTAPIASSPLAPPPPPPSSPIVVSNTMQQVKGAKVKALP